MSEDVKQRQELNGRIAAKRLRVKSDLLKAQSALADLQKSSTALANLLCPNQVGDIIDPNKLGQGSYRDRRARILHIGEPEADGYDYSMKLAVLDDQNRVSITTTLHGESPFLRNGEPFLPDDLRSNAGRWIDVEPDGSNLPPAVDGKSYWTCLKTDIEVWDADPGRWNEATQRRSKVKAYWSVPMTRGSLGTMERPDAVPHYAKQIV